MESGAHVTSISHGFDKYPQRQYTLGERGIHWKGTLLMRRRLPARYQQITRFEHLIVILSSFTWTGVVLLILVVVWGFQDAQARWALLERRNRAPTVELSPVVWRSYIDVPMAQVLPETPLEGTPTQTATPIPTMPTSRPPSTSSLSQPWRTPLSTPAPSPTLAVTLLVHKTATPNRSPTPTASRMPQPPVVTPTYGTPPAPVAREGAPDRLVIPSLGIDTPVVPVTWVVVQEGSQTYNVWQVADYAAGWHVTSALPGQPGNTVIAGHHNIKGEVFRYLADIEEGAEIDVYAGDAVYRYYVEQKIIVKEKGEPFEVRQQNARWIGPTDDVRLTLITCWPYTNNTHRVIVVAKPRP